MLQTEPYALQAARWPSSRRHILSQYDDDSIVVYQAYRPAIGRYAARHGHFGGEFSLSRMSWIKPGFLWMMYRSAWGTKEGQEVVLAVRLRRSAFDTILARAVRSSFASAAYASEADWKRALAETEGVAQWDPDHDPTGARLERRALQLGLRGETLRRYAGDWIVEIEDISGFVAEQRPHADPARWSNLLTPLEDIYPVADGEIANRLGIAG
jgi:hypothetical protein